MPCQILPATPGWTYLSPISLPTGEFNGFEKKPVIAWAIEEISNGEDGPAAIECFPVVPLEMTSHACDYYILLHPDGKYECPESFMADSEADALELLNECRVASENFRKYLAERRDEQKNH